MPKDAAQRKRDQRRREKAHLESVGATKFEMTMYRGTSEALQEILEAGGFEEPAEAITVLIHNAAKLVKRDMSQFNELTSITGLGE